MHPPKVLEREEHPPPRGSFTLTPSLRSAPSYNLGQKEKDREKEGRTKETERDRESVIMR